MRRNVQPGEGAESRGCSVNRLRGSEAGPETWREAGREHWACCGQAFQAEACTVVPDGLIGHQDDQHGQSTGPKGSCSPRVERPGAGGQASRPMGFLRTLAFLGVNWKSSLQSVHSNRIISAPTLRTDGRRAREAGAFI